MAQSISEAIKVVSEYLGRYAHLTAWNNTPWPITDEAIERRLADIEQVCTAMDLLADRPEIRFPDFEALRHQAATYGAFPLLADLNNVAAAFQEAGRLD
jgi:hypothetical protein